MTLLYGLYEEANLMNQDVTIGICSPHTLNLNLTVYYCGQKICHSSSWSPEYVDNYTMFYLFDGDGVITLADKEFAITQGQGFLVPPTETVSFQSSMDISSTIGWIGFYGLVADTYLERSGLNKKNPVFCDNENKDIGELFRTILKDAQLEHNRYCRLTASLYMIFSKLLDIYDIQRMHFNNNTTIENYIKQAMLYVNTNYMNKVTVGDIANHVGIDRKYLHYIFKKKLDIGPQQYIIIFRMSRACIYLSDTDKTISSISKAVGYDNPLNFSKMFKKTFNMSPKEYRKNPTYIKYNIVTWGKLFDGDIEYKRHKDM